MKVLVDIKDSKADFVMELLNNLRYVKTKKITPAKAKLIEDIKEAVEEVNLVKAGKLKSRSATDFINEL